MILKPVTHWSMGYCFPFDHIMKCMFFSRNTFFLSSSTIVIVLKISLFFGPIINRKALHSSVSVLPFIAVVKYRFMVCSLFFYISGKFPSVVEKSNSGGGRICSFIVQVLWFLLTVCDVMFLKNILKNNLVRVARFTKFFNQFIPRSPIVQVTKM